MIYLHEFIAKKKLNRLINQTDNRMFRLTFDLKYISCELSHRYIDYCTHIM